MPTTLHVNVLDALGRAIVQGALSGGEPLTLEWIQAQYGVSRTIARDCVRSLECMGMVDSRRRVGITVRPASEWTVLSPTLMKWQLDEDPDGTTLGALTELRTAIEPVAASAAAVRASDSERRNILSLAAQMHSEVATDDLDSFVLTDIAFHSSILVASHNEAFRALTDMVGEVLRGRAKMGVYPLNPTTASLALHDEIAEAIAKGDSPKAEEAMLRMVLPVRSALRQKGLTALNDTI
ncbi:FadR family transcriptional regulator [Schaalia sp. 19OD2882]|uniref:FadR/GntR family transcriptional regulator n=1 Tax=Schaalia sp. 19OD2882 TaxID=2794089 RepID=UPI001C1E96B8|nr:FCD domain-containing protein [Schaalia sp. 19OD2882]QWW19077.1 FadR family transcriptional regulator [Schaalia sp. 19OD2882]